MTGPETRMVHADADKPHRCPACWRVAVHAGPVLPWRAYRCCGCDDPSCGCGQRFARRPWLPHFGDPPGRPFRCTARAVKEALQMSGLRWRIWGPAEAFRGIFRYVAGSARAAITRREAS